MSPTSAGGARIPKQAASISPASLKRQEEVLPMAKLEQRRYKDSSKSSILQHNAFESLYNVTAAVLLISRCPCSKS